MGAPPFIEGDGGAAGFRGSCRAGLEDVPFAATRPGLEVRSCRVVPEDVPPAGGAAAAGGMFLPDRDVESGGLWVLRVGFPAEPGWELPGPGAVGVFGTAPAFSRLVERVLPGSCGGVETAEPIGWGWRGAVVPEGPLPAVTLVCVVLLTVLPPMACVVEWVERVDWECVPVPAGPG